MRLIIASCSVDYAGRLSAHLPQADRLIMLKSDGSVLIHSDGGSGWFQQEHLVYGREGQPCRLCGARVRALRMGQRSTFHCPRCQR